MKCNAIMEIADLLFHSQRPLYILNKAEPVAFQLVASKDQGLALLQRDLKIANDSLERAQIPVSRVDFRSLALRFLDYCFDCFEMLFE
jgi:hypothetical protein